MATLAEAEQEPQALPGEVTEEVGPSEAPQEEVKVVVAPSATPELNSESHQHGGDACDGSKADQELRDTADTRDSGTSVSLHAPAPDQVAVASGACTDVPPAPAAAVGLFHFDTVKGYKPHGKAMGMTLISTFLSLTFIFTITNIDPDSYQPCNNPSAAGCLYLKIFSAGNVSSTTGFFVSVLNGDADLVGLSSSIKDHSWHGEELSSSWSFHTGMRAAVSWMIAIGGDITYQPPALCPNMTVDDMRTFCTTIEMKEGAQNHLLGEGRQVFLLFTTLWCLFTVVHDCLVLEKRRQMAAFTAFAAVFARATAASTAAYWAFGSTSVFISPHKVEDCACFYQMPAVQALFTLVSPVLLLKASYQELLDWLRGVIYGEYLHFQSHRIPHHVEQSSSSWTSGHLMVWKEPILSQARMNPKVYKYIGWSYFLIIAAWEVACFTLIAPLAPSTLVRAEEVIVKFLQSADNQTGYATHWLYTILSWAIYFTPWTCLAWAAQAIYVFHLAYKVWSDEDRTCRTLATVALFCFFAVGSFFGSLWVFITSLSSPPSGLPGRETMVLRAELRAVGQYMGALLLSMAVVFYSSLKSIAAVQGLGDDKTLMTPSGFLGFCDEHPNVVQSVPDLLRLQEVAFMLLGANRVTPRPGARHFQNHESSSEALTTNSPQP